MKEITRINHIGLRVTNLARTRAFYEKLGFTFIVGPVGPEPVAIMEHASGVNINFILNSTDQQPHNVLMDEPKKHTGYTHIALEVSDSQAVQQQLVEMDIPLTEGPVTTKFGAVLIFIRDPDFNVIEFTQPPA